ncbi:MAG: glycosyltransferase family 4 protein [Methanobacteriota archaeon]
MRVAFFSWETLNSIPVGGVAAVVTKVAEALAAHGHEVHVFTRISAGQPEHEEINGVFEHRCVSPGCEDFIEYMDHVCDSLTSCYHQVKNDVGEFDVIHAHDWHVVNAVANIKHNTGKEFVWTAHSTEWGRNGGAFADNWFSARVRHREWLGGYLSKAVTTVSHSMKWELAREYNIPEDKINVIYNGINFEDFLVEVDAGKIKEKYGIWALDPVVLFLGRMCHQKGPDLLLEAIPDVLSLRRDIKFVFAGGGDDMIRHIIGRSQYLGVDGSIRVLGYVSDEDRISLYKASDVVCIPSRNEPFGIVTLEAWACGKPVVAADVGGPSEIIDNFRTGVKVYLTPESIAWGIKYLFGDPTGENMKKMGAEAQKEVEKYDWKQIAKQYKKVYEKL